VHENKLIGLDVDTTVNIFLCSESEDESADDGHVSEEEVTQTIIDEDGQEKTVTVMVQKPPKPKKRQSELTDQDGNDKDGEEKKKRKDKDKSRHKDKDSTREKDGKHSKHEKEGDEKDHKKKKRDKDRSGSYGGDSVYGKKDDKKKERRMTMDGLSEAPELININRRLEAAETGIKGLRNIIDSMVNQVDFGDEVGGMLKAQLDQVQQQLNKVELVPEGEAAKKEKKRKGSKAKGPQDMPQDGIITEGSQQGPGTVEGQGQSMKVVPVIPPPDRMSQDMPKLQPGRLPSRKDEKRKISLPMRGERPPSQGEKAPLRKRTTMEDLKLRKKAREEGVTIEEIEARETAQESKKEKKSKEKEKEKGKEDEKEKADKKKGEESSSDEESIDSEEEREAMEEMIMEEIEAALENTDDPEAQAYALRLSIEQMNNMKRNFAQSQEEFKKEMEKNKRAIELIAKDLAAFRSARKAQVSS